MFFTYPSVILILGAIFGIKIILGGSEDSWICVEGGWIKHGNPSSDMPINDCN
jgi:hypothetical protein